MANGVLLKLFITTICDMENFLVCAMEVEPPNPSAYATGPNKI